MCSTETLNTQTEGMDFKVLHVRQKILPYYTRNKSDDENLNHQ